MLLNYLLFLGYAATVPLANAMLTSVGSCDATGPCLIPVGLGLMAPSGVLVVGAALVIRDAIQQRLGAGAALTAIGVGCGVSYAFSAPSLVFASVAAFAVSEIADFLVYTPLRRRHLTMAVLISGAVGAAADSVVFLWLAFGSLDFIAGQIIGKLWVTLAAVALLVMTKRRARK